MLADHPVATIPPARPAAATGLRLLPAVAMVTTMGRLAAVIAMGRQHPQAAAIVTTMQHRAAAATIRPVRQAAAIGQPAVLPADIITDLTPISSRGKDRTNVWRSWLGT